MVLWVMVEDMEFCRNSNFDNKEHKMMVLGSKHRRCCLDNGESSHAWLDNKQ